MKLSIFFLIISLIFSNMIGYSQDKKNDNVITTADKKTYFHKEKYLNLTGHPMIKQGQDTITADNIKYFDEQKKAIGIGNVNVFDHENTVEISGKFGEYFIEDKYSKLITNTKLIAIKDNIVVFSEIMERFGKKKIYIAKNNVIIHMVKEKITALANIAVYEIKHRKVILTGNPQVFSNKTKYSADKIILYTMNKKIILEGNAEILKGNQKITADRIRYYSSDPNKKAILTGNPKFIEFSDKDSILKGKPYRQVTAKKIVYFNVNDGKAILTGEPKFKEFFVEQENDSDFVNFLIYKREGAANKIRYIGGDKAKYTLIGDARIYEPFKASFADRIDYIVGNKEVAILRGNPKIYEFYKKSDPDYAPNKIKRKGYADLVKYYIKSKKIILKGRAHVYEEDLEIKGDIIQYHGGDYDQGYIKGHAELRNDKEYAKADLIKYFGKNQDKIILSGKAYYENDEMTAKADYIEHNEKRGNTLLKGNAWVSDDEKEAFGDKIDYTNKEGFEKAILEGNPGLIDKNKAVYADQIEYTKENGNEIIFLHGKAKFIKKKKSVFANQIIYYTIKIPEQKENDEKIILKNQVRIIDPKKIITGDKGEYYFSNKTNDKTEKGILIGNCEINKKDGTLEAYSDTIEYFKNSDNKETMILKGNAEVSDDVKVGYGDKITFYPDIDGKNIDKIVLTGNPRIENDNSFTIGEKIVILDGELNQVKVYQNAKYFNEEESTEITAGFIFYDEDNDYIRAEKNPVYIQKKDDITVYSEQLESYREKKLSFATGDVKIVQGEKTIYGERAKFIENKNKVIVTGNASAVENNNVSRAEKIILYTKKKKIKLIGIKKGQLDASK